MRWREWDELPKGLQIPEVREYYDILSKKKLSLRMKRYFDVVVAAVMLACLSPAMLVIAVAIVLDSSGRVFYRQERVTQYGKIFRIHKFRTMVCNADKIGTQVTVENDRRITKIGSVLRKYRLDEIPQLIDILEGNMSFVGTRPEAKMYVREYKPEMRATLLLPAGVTSEASIRYKDEAMLLNSAEDADKVYVEEVLPAKMKFNLNSIKEFSFFNEILIMVRTIIAVVGKNGDKEDI